MSDEKHVTESTGKDGKTRVVHRTEDSIVTLQGKGLMTMIPVEDLQTWKGWSMVEKVVKDFDPPITPYELSVLEGVIGNAAGRNGFNEMKQALATTSRVRGTAADKIVIDDKA